MYAGMQDTYKELSNGKIKINTSSFFQYINTDVLVYIKQDCLCLSTLFEEISIPLKSVIEIRKVAKRALVGNWNKEDSYRSEKYKQYKIKLTNYGFYFFKSYYAIMINDPLGKFTFFVPCYDIDVIESLTNLKIVEGDNSVKTELSVTER